MAVKSKKNNDAVSIGKMFLFSTMAAAIAAGLLLVLSAVMLEKLGLTEGQAQIMIYVVYLVSALLAGLISGKWQREKKFLWGVLAGMVWFIVILLVSIISNGLNLDLKELFPAAVCMLGGGMLGGMLA